MNSHDPAHSTALQPGDALIEIVCGFGLGMQIVLVLPTKVAAPCSRSKRLLPGFTWDR